MKGPLYIVHGLGDAITYLSGQKIVEAYLKSDHLFQKFYQQFFDQINK
ncbi:hypothetical protein [Spiroplasma endosymbiont of Danaus chrysippus]|nr:hypothetical protein [Spiroplasma endosymbiont of Danaus chrysippus]